MKDRADAKGAKPAETAPAGSAPESEKPAAPTNAFAGLEIEDDE